MALIVLPQRLLPVRGLVPLHNRKGQSLAVVDVHRWIRLNRLVHKVQKLDFLAHHPLPSEFHDMVEFARGLDIQPSLRTNCEWTPNKDELAKQRFFDVLLTPRSPQSDAFRNWLRLCAELALPVRVQCRLADLGDVRAEQWIADLVATKVVAVTLVANDSFEAPGRRTGNPSQADIEKVATLIRSGNAHGIEVNVFGVASESFSEELRSHVGTERQYHLDHQQYAKGPYELAENLFDRSVYTIGKILMVLSARHTSARVPVDDWFLEWLFCKHKFVMFWVLFFRKLTRDLRPQRAAAFDPTDPSDPTDQSDGITHGAWAKQPKYYDPIDALRAHFDDRQRALAQQAKDIMANRPPDKVVKPRIDYGAYKKFHEPLSNAIRWMAISREEKISSSIAWLEAPFTASVTFGGGFAEYVGFAVGRYGKILCPMEEFTHRLTLHVAEDGSYVLLRDGELMHPVEFEDRTYAPLRLVYPIDLFLSLWNIDGEICTQNVDIWHGEHTGIPDRSGVKYSVVIFSTRFSRRLQFVLQSIVNQTGIDLTKIEVLVGYVPGIDTTDDIIDSLRLSHPEARIVRVPFPEQNIKSKGFVLNECCRAAAGEWIVILDSDILLPPTMFAEIERAANGAVFMAPEGRGMLDKATTARVLLGEVAPWKEWEGLLAGCAEMTQGEAEGIPIGYCQIFRKDCLDKVQYAEYEHFERADSDFGLEMRKAFGREKRLEGVRVLHLDHGGSQWFGVYKHQ